MVRQSWGIFVVAILLSCGRDDAADKGVAACLLTSSQVPSVNSCIEFIGLSEKEVEEAKTACEHPEADISKSWLPGQHCQESQRIGSCSVSTTHYSTVTYLYSTGTVDQDQTAIETAKTKCETGSATEPAGVWTTL